MGRSRYLANFVFSLNHSLGQVCMAGSRIYVQESIHDKFVEGFTRWAESLSSATGGPFEEGTLHGPQVSKTQFDVSFHSIR
jgi:aldehyde dehydrogenase (NAD+)